MADLSSAFEGLGLAQNTLPPVRHHTINITYPALHLLPANTQPYLYPPKDLRLRQRPRLGTCHLTPADLSFFHRIPVRPYKSLSYAPYLRPSMRPDEFMQMMCCLQLSPGHSNLEIVSFDTGIGYRNSPDVCHILRATVTMKKPERDCSRVTVHTSHIYGRALHSLLRRFSPSGPSSNAQQHSWLSLVLDLVHRGSDRACLHVAHQLQASRTAAHRGEGARWARDWETSMPRSGSSLLASHLRCDIGGGGLIPLHELDSENLAAHQNVQIAFVLPCDDSAEFKLKDLSLTDDVKSAEVACLTCGRKVLDENDLEELALRREYHERAAFCYSDAEFSDAKIALPAVGRGRELEIPPGVLHHVLQHALESLRVPVSASPAALSLVDVQETRAVLRDLQTKAAATGGQSVHLTPYALWEALSESSMGTLTSLSESGNGELPPGFMDFVGKWLTRAVNLLIADQGLLASTEEVVEELSSLMSTCEMR